MVNEPTENNHAARVAAARQALRDALRIVEKGSAASSDATESNGAPPGADPSASGLTAAPPAPVTPAAPTSAQDAQAARDGAA